MAGTHRRKASLQLLPLLGAKPASAEGGVQPGGAVVHRGGARRVAGRVDRCQSRVQAARAVVQAGIQWPEVEASDEEALEAGDVSGVVCGRIQVVGAHHLREVNQGERLAACRVIIHQQIELVEVAVHQAVLGEADHQVEGALPGCSRRAQRPQAGQRHAVHQGHEHRVAVHIHSLGHREAVGVEGLHERVLLQGRQVRQVQPVVAGGAAAQVVPGLTDLHLGEERQACQGVIESKHEMMHEQQGRTLRKLVRPRRCSLRAMTRPSSLVT